MNLDLKSSIRALGEVALAVQDMDSMCDFYENRLGLELLRRFPDGDSQDKIGPKTVFFQLAPGHQGHAQVLALFEPRPGHKVTSGTTSLHHFAFNVDAADFSRLLQKVQAESLLRDTAYHAWANWSSLYIEDPEGNVVELVAYGDLL